MGNQITIGQYLPGDSSIHRLDPRVKLLLVLIFMFTAFLVDTFQGYGLYMLLILFVTWQAQVPLDRRIYCHTLDSSGAGHQPFDPNHEPARTHGWHCLALETPGLHGLSVPCHCYDDLDCATLHSDTL